MRVYYAGRSKGDHSIFVCPAADPEAIKGGVDSEWVDEDGQPRSFTIMFKGGRAEVSDAMGRYLIASGLAKRSNLFLPRTQLAA